MHLPDQKYLRYIKLNLGAYLPNPGDTFSDLSTYGFDQVNSFISEIYPLPPVSKSDFKISNSLFSSGNLLSTSSDNCDYKDTSGGFSCLGGGTDGYSTVYILIIFIQNINSKNVHYFVG